MRVLCNKSPSFISSKLNLHCFEVFESYKNNDYFTHFTVQRCLPTRKGNQLCKHLTGVKCTNILIEVCKGLSTGISIRDGKTTKRVFDGQ